MPHVCVGPYTFLCLVYVALPISKTSQFAQYFCATLFFKLFNPLFLSYICPILPLSIGDPLFVSPLLLSSNLLPHVHDLLISHPSWAHCLQMLLRCHKTWIISFFTGSYKFIQLAPILSLRCCCKLTQCDSNNSMTFVNFQDVYKYSFLLYISPLPIDICQMFWGERNINPYYKMNGHTNHFSTLFSLQTWFTEHQMCKCLNYLEYICVQ